MQAPFKLVLMILAWLLFLIAASGFVPVDRVPRFVAAGLAAATAAFLFG